MLQTQSPSLSLESSSKLSDSDIFCISRVLEENFSFLTELHLNGQTLSQTSINILSQGLKSNHILTKISLGSIQFDSLAQFYKIPEALTLNEALTFVDLSSNSLTDTTSNALLELLGVLPYLKSLNISYNSLESIQWGNILAVNSSLELLFIDYNNLNYSSICNLIESLSVNRTLKVLSLVHNQKSEEFVSNCAKLLSRVLKSSTLHSLSLDLNEHCLHLTDLATTIIESNTDLAEIPPLEEIPDPNEAIQLIWAGLKANRWIFNKLQDPGSDIDIEPDFQEVLESKLTRLKEQEFSPSIKIEETVEVPNLDTPQFSSYSSGKMFKLENAIEGLEKAENDLIAQAYNSPREELTEEKSLISTSIFNDSPRNFTYSESSKSGTPVLESPRVTFEKDALKHIQRYIRNCEDRFLNALESVKIEFMKEFQGFAHYQQEMQEQVQVLGKSVQVLEENLKNNEKKWMKNVEKGFEGVEFKLNTLEKGEKFRVQELAETKLDLLGVKDSLKEMSGKVEKNELNNKLQMNSIKKSMCKKQDIVSVQEKQGGIVNEIQNLNLNFTMIDGNSEKIKQMVVGLQRNEKVYMKKKDEHEVALTELRQKLLGLEERVEEIPNFNSISHSLQKDLESKLTKMEIRVWDTLESDTSKEVRSSSLKTIDKKIALFEEKLKKVYESIQDLAKSLNKIENLKVHERLEKLEKEVLQQSLKKIQSFIPLDNKKPLKVVENPDNSRSYSNLKPKYSTRNSPVIRPPSVNGISSRIEESSKDFFSKQEESELRLPEPEVYIEKRLKRSEEFVEYLPGEAESIVLSAIIDKANKNRTPCMRKSFSSVSLIPNMQTATSKTMAGFKRFTEELSPSIELQESLKQRGINF